MIKVISWGIGIILSVPILYLVLLYGASELGGEVVILDRPEVSGEESQVRIWIVDQGGTSWIEHGDTESFYLAALAESPRVVLRRNGETVSYVGKPDHDAHDLYHKLRREKYRWADQLIALLTGGNTACDGVPVRLQLER